MSEQQKPAPKKTKKTKQIPTPKFERPTARVSYEASGGLGIEHHGAISGDAMTKIDLPTADRTELSHHLAMLAGHVASTLGDPIEGATILVVTKRKR